MLSLIESAWSTGYIVVFVMNWVSFEYKTSVFLCASFGRSASVQINTFNVRSFLITACFSSFFASSGFCHLLITLANSLDPDQDQLNVGPDLDPNSLTL